MTTQPKKDDLFYVAEVCAESHTKTHNIRPARGLRLLFNMGPKIPEDYRGRTSFTSFTSEGKLTKQSVSRILYEIAEMKTEAAKKLQEDFEEASQAGLIYEQERDNIRTELWVGTKSQFKKHWSGKNIMWHFGGEHGAQKVPSDTITAEDIEVAIKNLSKPAP